MLSMKCPSCGATISFDENNISTFCSFCGAHLPVMTDYVKKAADLDIRQKQHAIDMETMDKEAKHKSKEMEYELKRLREENRRLKLEAKKNEDPVAKRVKITGIIMAVALIALFVTTILPIFLMMRH